MYFVIDNDCVVSSIITIDFANKNDSIFAAICNYEEVSLLTILNLRALNFDYNTISNDST